MTKSQAYWFFNKIKIW